MKNVIAVNKFVIGRLHSQRIITGWDGFKRIHVYNVYKYIVHNEHVVN